MIGPIILQVVLIFLNAVFASAEIAVISINDARLEQLRAEKNKRAIRLLKLVENPSKFLSTIQVAITLASLMGSAYAADSFSTPLVKWLAGLGVPLNEATLDSICVFMITIILSFFSIVFGELVPKRLAMRNAEKMALGLSGLLKFVSVGFAPFVWILTKSTNGILRLLRINPDEPEEAATEEEIRMLLDSGSKHGTIDSLENEMIQNVFEFDDIRISEICIHRRDTVFLHTEDSFETWLETIKETGLSFYPVCGEDADDVIAILNTKRLFTHGITDKESALQKVCEKPYFVPENTKADVVFSSMRNKRTYFAVVVDEYGGTSGIITLHDLIELLVGDLYEKDDPATPDIKKIGENKWEIAGCAPLDDVRRELGLPIESEDYDTFGGYIFDMLDSVPDDGSEFEFETENLLIKVKSVEDHRIERTVVKKKHID